MGNYTEYTIIASLKRPIHHTVTRYFRALQKWVTDAEETKHDDQYLMKNVDDHPFFKCGRFCNIKPDSLEIVILDWDDKPHNSYILLFEGDIKNYDDEIDKFYHWISPFCDEITGIQRRHTEIGNSYITGTWYK